jgi:hypothetical protein
MSDAIQKVETGALTARVQAMQTALAEESAMRGMVREYVSRHMLEGTDYGKIPGTDKPTLLKPGAEKLTDLFRCTPKFALLKSEEDFDRGFFNYVFRVRLFSRDANAVLAEGFGSANSREGRYRWRNANRKCPNCTKETIFRSKNQDEFYCWKKKGGCGATFPLSDTRITEQPDGRVENDDIATLANTILKMAKKRALVDGAIALARCSDMFTQDVEDLHYEPDPGPSSEYSSQGQAQPAQQRPAPSAQPIQAKSGANGSALRARTKRLWDRATEQGWGADDVKAWVGQVLGAPKPSSDFTAEDLAKLEESFERGLKQTAGATP